MMCVSAGWLRPPKMKAGPLSWYLSIWTSTLRFTSSLSDYLHWTYKVFDLMPSHFGLFHTLENFNLKKYLEILDLLNREHLKTVTCELSMWLRPPAVLLGWVTVRAVPLKRRARCWGRPCFLTVSCPAGRMQGLRSFSLTVGTHLPEPFSAERSCWGGAVVCVCLSWILS